MGAEEEERVSSTELVLRASAPNVADDLQLQHLWLALQKRSWKCLALVAGSKGLSTLRPANSLAKIAWWFTGQPSCVLDMRDLSLRLLEHQIRDMSAQLRGAERAFMALRSIGENPTAVPLARAADAVLLCVELGRTEMRSAERAVATIGRERFVGTLLVRPSDDGGDEEDVEGATATQQPASSQATG